MKQVEIYKEALITMENAECRGEVGSWRYDFPRVVGSITFFFENRIYFSGLCKLISVLSSSLSTARWNEVKAKFLADSIVVTGKQLKIDFFWFTDIKEDEPKARAERIEHLESLIKLYEDDTDRDL